MQEVFSRKRFNTNVNKTQCRWAYIGLDALTNSQSGVIDMFNPYRRAIVRDTDIQFTTILYIEESNDGTFKAIIEQRFELDSIRLMHGNHHNPQD